MAILRDESAGGSVLQRLFQITRDILQAQDLTPALESIARGLSELYGCRCTYTVDAADGALPIPGRNGEPLAFIVSDIPPTRDMQLFLDIVGLALDHTRAQSEFFTIVAHEVRSPLAAIRGATSLLDVHFDSLDKERRDELLGVLASSTSRLSTIFEDFLLLSRMDAGKLTLRMEAVDPVLVIEESVARMESQHPERRFQTLYLAPVPPVHADEGRIVQILTNILSNAAKYSAADSVIAVEVKVEDERVVFAVKNEGPGVAGPDREKMFTRFGRGSQNGDASIGLGLHICAQLAAMMGGSIGFESEPNKITTFWFALPRFSVVELHSEDPPRYP